MTITAFTGTSRTEYKNWVKAWKSEYNALSAEIRTLKSQRKEKLWAYREANSGNETKKRTAIGDNPNYNASAAHVAQYLSARATALLNLRAAAKETARQQYDAAHSVAAA